MIKRKWRRRRRSGWLLGIARSFAVAHLPGDLSQAAQPEEQFWRRNNVERRRKRATVLEIAHPQLRPREFPLFVCSFLYWRGIN